MDYGIDTILRISGNAQDDEVIMSKFLQFIESESKNRLEIINRLYNLNEVLDKKGFLAAHDAMIGVRHLNQSVMQINKAHHQGVLAPLTKEAAKNFLVVINDAIKKFQYLEDIYTFDCKNRQVQT